MKEREKLKSRLGFILISAGCAIGIGNSGNFLTLQEKVAVARCTVLPDLSGDSWTAGYDYGICRWQSQPEKSGKKLIRHLKNQGRNGIYTATSP